MSPRALILDSQSSPLPNTEAPSPSSSPLVPLWAARTTSSALPTSWLLDSALSSASSSSPPTLSSPGKSNFYSANPKPPPVLTSQSPENLVTTPICHGTMSLQPSLALALPWHPAATSVPMPRQLAMVPAPRFTWPRCLLVAAASTLGFLQPPWARGFETRFMTA